MSGCRAGGGAGGMALPAPPVGPPPVPRENVGLPVPRRVPVESIVAPLLAAWVEPSLSAIRAPAAYLCRTTTGAGHANPVTEGTSWVQAPVYGLRPTAGSIQTRPVASRACSFSATATT